ncbi:MAG: lysophospholipid acyltransferase family protein [Deltaproteobacteria bacterium]|nr:lysophospholipid acyltransferase family protein [Deltaproteobacteria bacterium]
MPLFRNSRSFLSAIRLRLTVIDEKGAQSNIKKDTWARRRSDAIIAFSRYALQKNLMVIAYYLLRLYFLTMRIEAVNEDAVIKHLDEGKKAIVAIWHQRFFLVIRYALRFSRYHPSVMISQSRDGDLGADIFRRMNFRPVRGSSSRGGKQALAAMVDDLKDHSVAAHVLDGPRGPIGVMKPGLIVMAQRSGAPIIPIYVSVNRAWVLKSWDRCLIPKPFSTITFRWDEPIPVPHATHEHEFENIRLNLERHMLENQRRDDGRRGWSDLI